MKVRLYCVHTDKSAILATLTEHDVFRWLSHAEELESLVANADKIFDAVNSIGDPRQEDPHYLINETGGRIKPDERVHIIGDFDSIPELCQWIKMQHLLGAFDLNSITELTR